MTQWTTAFGNCTSRTALVVAEETKTANPSLGDEQGKPSRELRSHIVQIVFAVRAGADRHVLMVLVNRELRSHAKSDTHTHKRIFSTRWTKGMWVARVEAPSVWTPADWDLEGPSENKDWYPEEELDDVGYELAVGERRHTLVPTHPLA